MLTLCDFCNMRSLQERIPRINREIPVVDLSLAARLLYPVLWLPYWKFLSSPNIDTLKVRSLLISLTYKKNITGPSPEPRGMPLFTLNQGDRMPFRTSLCFLSKSQSSIQLGYYWWCHMSPAYWAVTDEVLWMLKDNCISSMTWWTYAGMEEFLGWKISGNENS